MPAYLIVDIHIRDTAAFGEYRKLVPATIEKYGGRYIVRGGLVAAPAQDQTRRQPLLRGRRRPSSPSRRRRSRPRQSTA